MKNFLLLLVTAIFAVGCEEESGFANSQEKTELSEEKSLAQTRSLEGAVYSDKSCPTATQIDCSPISTTENSTNPYSVTYNVSFVNAFANGVFYWYPDYSRDPWILIDNDGDPDSKVIGTTLHEIGHLVNYVGARLNEDYHYHNTYFKRIRGLFFQLVHGRRILSETKIEFASVQATLTETRNGEVVSTFTAKYTYDRPNVVIDGNDVRMKSVGTVLKSTMTLKLAESHDAVAVIELRKQ